MTDVLYSVKRSPWFYTFKIIKTMKCLIKKQELFVTKRTRRNQNMSHVQKRFYYKTHASFVLWKHRLHIQCPSTINTWTNEHVSVLINTYITYTWQTPKSPEYTWQTPEKIIYTSQTSGTLTDLGCRLFMINRDSEWVGTTRISIK